ncbi:hypothetical protein HELRODRAFT_178923 [Helobdella robusta]|uniref:CBM21 domain-containing protein n=1 Tax=Helobdella robusta TaxID=6412 RepID=T1FDW6_HELRO|nr:hypothetical protein HELRODRAFT_178923 [Helobdella robusta]ESN96003.1 hypothetical protein HELRODRAFT_178923 [Helobdella robusta]
MALNFPSYLLASSPPGFELLSDRWLESRSSRSNSYRSSFTSSTQTESLTNSRSDRKKTASSAEDLNNSSLHVGYEYKDARLETNRDKEKDKIRISEWEQSYNWDLSELALNLEDVDNKIDIKIPRKISFADELGKELTEVKMAAEPSDVPPVLSPETIQKIQQTLSDAFIDDDDTSTTSSPTSWEPEYKLILVNFEEPHLNLLALHNHIEQMNVSLASIKTQVGKLICGTVETKCCPGNVRSAKEVVLRYTLDGWKTSMDVQCNFVSAVGGTNHELFSFQFPLNNNMNVQSSGDNSSKDSIVIEFAICYRTESGNEFWDNNSNLNYKISCKLIESNNNMHNTCTKSDVFNGSRILHNQVVPSQKSLDVVFRNPLDFDNDFGHPYW